MDIIKNKINVILDTGEERLLNNKLFNPDIAKEISHTFLPMYYLYEEASKQNINLITPDIFLNNLKDFDNKDVLLISHLITKNTEKLIKLGVKPIILTCQESPFIATRFYVNLKKYSSLFKYSMLFNGMQKMTSKKTIFIPMYFPQFFSDEKFKPIPFRDKKFITYIASNKEIKSLLKIITIKFLYGFNIKNIYPLRKKLIQFLSQRSDFDLYGRGWGSETSHYIKKVYKGEINDKEKKLREYKYVICLENAIFPGYITEKIFDCFFAGSVPVYLGAPDIDIYIPKNTFINIASFKDFEEVDKFLESINEVAYNKYLENIKNFLESNEYKKFSHQRFAEIIIDIIKLQ